MKHKTLEQVDKERAKFRLACDYYSQLILIGEEDGESWIYWDTKSLNETETLLKSALSYIKAQKGGQGMIEIKAGNCYMCLKDIEGYDSFTKGKVYASLYDNALINDNHIEVLVRPSNYFRIATGQEIKAQKGE